MCVCVCAGWTRAGEAGILAIINPQEGERERENPLDDLIYNEDIK